MSGICATELPVFVTGAVSSSPGKDGPGEISAAIVCGGAVVQPGDILVGDEDGVVVVPLADAPYVIEKLAAIREKEEKMLVAILAGHLIPEWVDETLASKHYEIIMGDKDQPGNLTT